jgi:hypothetical protein
MIRGSGDEGFQVEAQRASTDDLPYCDVGTAKFVLLSLLTLGLYELVWFYRNWRRVKIQAGREIRPFWRALFSPFYCYSFASTVKRTADSLHTPSNLNPGAITAGYVALLLLTELPDPWWLVGLLTFVPLLPIQQQIRSIHQALRPGSDNAEGWRPASLAALAIGGACTGFVVMAMLGPPTHALRHAEIPESYGQRLVELGVAEPGESLRYFYSNGLFSIEEDGNLLTDRRVVSYETFEGELLVAEAAYADIAELEVEYARSELSDTVVTVFLQEGESFLLYVSTEKGRDKEFVGMLEAELPPGR